MVDALGRQFAAEDFPCNRFGFDDSWDCTQLKERLEELYLDGRIDSSPTNPRPSRRDRSRPRTTSRNMSAATCSTFLRRHEAL